MPDAKPTLTPAQQARRDRIVDAGLSLLGERAYDKIQVKDVAEAANVALGTLYHYFSSKEHLFAEVLVRWAATLRTMGQYDDVLMKGERGWQLAHRTITVG